MAGMQDPLQPKAKRPHRLRCLLHIFNLKTDQSTKKMQTWQTDSLSPWEIKLRLPIGTGREYHFVWTLNWLHEWNGIFPSALYCKFWHGRHESVKTDSPLWLPFGCWHPSCPKSRFSLPFNMAWAVDPEKILRRQVLRNALHRQFLSARRFVDRQLLHTIGLWTSLSSLQRQTLYYTTGPTASLWVNILGMFFHNFLPSYLANQSAQGWKSDSTRVEHCSSNGV